MGGPSILPQVKICGLTRVYQARACAALTPDAIGLVFYPGSPRHVSDDQARAISNAVHERVRVIGVFVNADYDTIMKKIAHCHLTGVQLHGAEPPELVSRLARRGVTVIKALFVGGTPSLADARGFPAAGFLVECAKGPLPGGNALAWNWRAAREFGRAYPLILAGGLSPDNIDTAVSDALPVAVDVSSGVEQAPGEKSIEKVRAFMDAVIRIRTTGSVQLQGSRVF